MYANIILKENVYKCYPERKSVQMLPLKKMCANVILKENVCKCYPERKCKQILSWKKMCVNVILKENVCKCYHEKNVCKWTKILPTNYFSRQYNIQMFIFNLFVYFISLNSLGLENHDTSKTFFFQTFKLLEGNVSIFQVYLKRNKYIAL